MIKFKDAGLGTHYGALEFPSAQVTLKSSSHTLYLKFDSKDILIKASYSGPEDLWLGSLCLLVPGKHLGELLNLRLNFWDETFRHDQTYWDIKGEGAEKVIFPALELMSAALDVYRGRDYLYRETSGLICRCFGITEKDVLDYVRSTDDPNPEGLGKATKAGLGCRSCVSQISKWLSIITPKGKPRFYKERSHADWLLEIDQKLTEFPEGSDWKMEVKNIKGPQVIIEFDKKVSQIDEEVMTQKLQSFLSGLDSDLSFFLIRARQRS
jgi:bacterioferritin-associated ferredoxin